MDRTAPSRIRQTKEGVRDLLIYQYALHELGHHPRAAAADDPSTVLLEPEAHTVSDVYKCLHQGVFGVGHSIRNREDFEGRLAREMARARPGSAEPILEHVSPDGMVLRANLRPYRAMFAGDEERGCELLLRVCLESAAIETGTPEQFFTALAWFRDLNKAGELAVGKKIFSFPEETVDGFLQEIRKLVSSSGFVPVLSHSPVYRSLNQPSYRVVHLQALMRSPLALLVQTPLKGGPGNGH